MIDNEIAQNQHPIFDYENELIFNEIQENYGQNVIVMKFKLVLYS